MNYLLNLNFGVIMKFIITLILVVIISLNLNAQVETRSRLLGGDWSKIEISMIGAADESLYMAVDSSLYYKEKRAGEWEKIYEFSFLRYYHQPEYTKTVQFFKDNEFNIVMTSKNTLYKIDPNTQDVTPVFSTLKPITSVVFDTDKTVIIDETAFYVVDENYQLTQHYELESLGEGSMDMSHVYGVSRMYYSPEIGFGYNLEVFDAWSMMTRNQTYASQDSLEVILEAHPESLAIAYLAFISNLSNNVVIVGKSGSYGVESVLLVDLKTGKKLELPMERFRFEESGDIFTATGYYDEDAKYSTNRGLNWETISKYDFDNLSACESGIIYGYSPSIGLMAYDTKDKKWYSDKMPNHPISDIVGGTKDYFRVGDNLWALWANKGIIKSTDNGKTWLKINLPVDNDYQEALFVDNDENLYYICDNGLYRKLTNHNWEKLFSDMPDYLIEDFQIVEANEDRALVGFKSGDYYDLMQIKYQESTLEDLQKPYEYMQETKAGNILFVSKDEKNILVEYDKDLTLLNQSNLDASLEISKAEFDSQNNIFIATNKGVYKGKNWESNFTLLGDLDLKVDNMFLNENDSLIVGYEDSYYLLCLIQPNSNNIDTIKNVKSWSLKTTKFLAKDNTFIADAFNTKTTYYYKLFDDQPKLILDLTYPQLLWSEGEEQKLNITSQYPNPEDFEVTIQMYNGTSDTTIHVQGSSVDFNLPYKSHQALRLRITGKKEGYKDFRSNMLEITCTEGAGKIKVISNYDKYYTGWDTDKMASYLFEISKAAYSSEVEGEINILNSLDGSNYSFKYDGISPIEYSFYIPKETKEGIYKITYSGNSEEYGETAEEYFYYIVSSWIFDSVEEENSIITNTNVYPNPAASNVEVQFEMKEAGSLSCDIYDLNGNIVLSIPTEGYHAAGQASLSFDISALTSGQYLIFLKAQGKVTATKLVISK